MVSQHSNQRYSRSSSSITQCSHVNIKTAQAMKYRTIPGRDSHSPASCHESRTVCCVCRLKRTAHHPFPRSSRPRYDLAVDRKIKAQFGCHERREEDLTKISLCTVRERSRKHTWRRASVPTVRGWRTAAGSRICPKSVEKPEPGTPSFLKLTLHSKVRSRLFQFKSVCPS